MHQLTRAISALAATAMLAVGLAAQSGQQARSGAQPNAGVASGRQDPEDARPGASAAPVSGGLGKAGSGHLGFRLGYYDNGDNLDGNPFLDESLTVIEPVVFFDYNVDAHTNLWAKFSYDNVSSASIDRLSKFSEQSGASGDYYFGLEFGATWSLDDDTRAGAFLHASTEYDYRSFGLGGSYAKDFNDDSTTLKFTGSAYFDSLDVIRFNGVENGSDNRTAVNLGATWYQVLDRRTHAETGFNLTLQNGFLETPYNAVVREGPADTAPNPNLVGNVAGTEFTEELPSSRVRTTVFGRVRRMFGESVAFELGGRLYTDDWGVNSVTLDPAVYFWLVPDTVRAKVHYRYYTQTAADDYQERFMTAALPEFRTQDADLGEFSSNTVGVRLDWWTSARTRWDFTFDYQVRDDGLDNMWGSIGWTYSF